VIRVPEIGTFSVGLNKVASAGGVRQLFDRSELFLLVVVDGSDFTTHLTMNQRCAYHIARHFILNKQLLVSGKQWPPLPPPSCVGDLVGDGTEKHGVGTKPVEGTGVGCAVGPGVELGTAL